MISHTGICYLDLPKVPDSIIKQLNYNYDEYEINDPNIYPPQTNTWTKTFNSEINQWCQQHISPTLYWGFMIMHSDLRPHTDVKTELKLTYLIRTGGDNVKTEFYEDDKVTLIESVIIEPFRWHLFRSDIVHAVKGIEPDHTRFSVSASIFRKD